MGLTPSSQALAPSEVNISSLRLLEENTIMFNYSISDKPSEQTLIYDWVNLVSTKENCPPEGIMDCNNKKSYGCMCFQYETFKTQVKRFNLLPLAEDNELYNMIGDCDFTKLLARKMLMDDRLAYRNWLNVSKQIGLWY
jgi:hypothetical protein